MTPETESKILDRVPLGDGRRLERTVGPRLDEAREEHARLSCAVRLQRLGRNDELAALLELGPLIEDYLRAQSVRWKPRYLAEVRVALGEILAGVPNVAGLTAGAVEKARDLLPGSNRTRDKKAKWAVGFARWLD